MNASDQIQSALNLGPRLKDEISEEYSGDSVAIAACIIRATEWAFEASKKDASLRGVYDYWNAMTDAVLLLTRPGTYSTASRMIRKDKKPA